MKRFYNFLVVAVSMLAFTTLSYGQLDCPVVNISAGATNVMGTDFVCESSSITITWNATTDPGVTGYRLRVGNDAQIDNLNVEYVTHTGAPTYSATFNVGAGQGNSYSYTVDYTKDAGFNPVNGPSYDYSVGDCTNDPNPYPNFVIATDPSHPTAAEVAAADADNGDANTVCANLDFDVDITEGANGAGDLGQYYYRINGGAWVAAGTSSTITLTASNNFGSGAGTGDFTLAGPNTIDVAAADPTCGFNQPITVSQTINLTIRDIAEINAVNFDADNGNSGNNDGAVNAVAEGDLICFDGSTGPYDQFDISYIGAFDGGPAGPFTLNISTDSGATAGATLLAFASGDPTDVTLDETNYAYWLTDPALCVETADTFHVSTIDNPDVAGGFAGFEISSPQETKTVVAGPNTLTACDGEDVVFDLAPIFDQLGDPTNATIRLRNFSDATNIGAEVPLSNLAASDSSFTFTADFATQNTDNIAVQVRDCAGNLTASAQVTLNINTPIDVTGSSFSITREDNVTLINDGDDVCSGELLDFAFTAAGNLGTGGQFKIYKTEDGGMTYTSVYDGGVGVNPPAVPVDYPNHNAAATYVAAIVSDCDSLPVAANSEISVGVFNATGNLTGFAIEEASLADNLACNSESITLQAFPSTFGNDNPITVEFFSSVDNDPLTAGDNTSLGNGILDLGAGAYELNINFGNSPVYYFAVLTSQCNTSTSPVSPQISNHDETVIAPTVFDVSIIGAGGTDEGTAVNTNATPICAGETVYIQTNDGDLLTSDDGSDFEWRIDTGNGLEALAEDASGQVSFLANDDNAIVEVRISGGCAPATAWATFTLDLHNPTTMPMLTQLEEDNGGTVVIAADDAICNGNDINFVFNTMTVGSDNPTIGIYNVTDGVFDVAPVAVIAGPQTLTLTSGVMAAGDEYELRYASDCISPAVAVGASHTVSYLIENMYVANLTSVDVADGAFVCEDNGVTVNVVNPGTLGDDDNFGNTAEYVFEVSVDGGAWNEVSRGAMDNYTVDIDAVIIANGGFGNVDEIDVRSYIDGGCTPTANTNVFDINIYDGQNNFTSISLTNDNYCADESATIPVTMTANGAALLNDGFTKVVWYSIDDSGNPVGMPIKSTLAGTPGASQLLFNGGDGPAPDTTTTIGVRLESCDTSAFEVRTITVKDLPENNDEAGNPAVVSASPSSVCAGASSTLNIINYIAGTNGQVTWYDDNAATTLLATGPSFTASNLFNAGASTDTTFYVRIEADCDTTMLLPVVVNLSSVNPEPVQNFNGISAAGATMVGNAVSVGTICDEETINVDAITGEIGDGSYIWEISFDGIVFSSIDDASPGDNLLALNTGTFSLNFDGNGEATVFIRARRTNGCITTDNRYASVVVRELPTDFTSIAPTTEEVCETDAAITLTANGGDAGFDGVIRWYLEYNLGGFNPVPAWDGMTSVTFDWNNFSGAGDYGIFVQYESAACGTFIPTAANSNVTVNATPMNDLGANPVAEVCSNSSIDLAPLSSYTGVNQSFSFTGTGVAANVYDAANGSYPDATAENFETITYSVTENGCTANFSVTLEVNGTPVIDNATATIASCGVNDGTVEVTGITGGDAPYMYSSNDGGTYGAANPMTGLAGGNKNVRVMDAEGCESDAFAILVPNSSGFASAGTVDSPVSCNGDADGEVSVTLSNGLSPFDYEVFLDGGVTPIETASNQSATSYTFDNLAPGAYDFEFTDAAGCLTTYSVVLAEPGIIGLTVANAEDVDCFGEENGVLGNLSATSSNGGPFMYQLSIDTSGNQEFEVVSAFNMANNYTGLAAGDYLITVKDGNDCTNDFLFTIEEPEAIVLDTNVVALDQDGYDVQIVVQSGGVGQFEYRLNSGTFQTSNLFEDLPFGTYDFTARDANGCEETITIQLRDPNSINEAAIFAGVTAYPNPFAGVITVDGLQEGVNITMTNVYGQQVDFIASMKDGKAVINTIDLASGVYFATFTKDGASKTIRMVKQ